MKDDLGNRMKDYYESRTKVLLPRRTYTMIRIDGKAFHTYTKGLTRPFDDVLMNDMDGTARYLCQNIQGAEFAFVQSDEISILLTDFRKLGTQAWFNGNVQKMVSVSASMATAKFNQFRVENIIYNSNSDARFVEYENLKLAEFDSRVWTIPHPVEVANYFVWRQQDTVRNSISSVAQSLYSAKELNGKNTTVQKEMIRNTGVSWDDFPDKAKMGRIIASPTTDNGRSEWLSIAAPDLSNDNLLQTLIPIQYQDDEQ